MKTIKEQLITLGMKENELDNHCSDLYILKNTISTNFINSYEFKCNVTTFRSEIDNNIWYEIPFAYTEDYKGNKLTLKPIFKNLIEFAGTPKFKTEWSEADFKNVNKALRKLFSIKTLQNHRGENKVIRGIQDIESFFGLPYTSSSSYAMIGNTNTRYCVDVEENYNIELFAITTDNKIILEAWDNEENEKYFIIG